MESFIQNHYNKDLIDVIIYHHPCQDGQSASWVVKHYLDSIGKSYELIGMQHFDYVKPDYLAKLYDRVKDKYVIVLDFSFTLEITQRISEITKGIVILDHHITSRDTLQSIEFAYFDMDLSGVGLAWKYIHPSEEMPLFIQMIQDRDLWEWKVPQSKDFCEGLFNYLYITENNEEGYKIYEEIYKTGNLDKYIEFGRVLRIKKDKTLAKMVKNTKKYYKYRHNGQILRVKIANCDKEMSSDLGNALCDEGICDFAVTWRYDHKLEEYWVNLRSTNEVDVSNISKRYKGGGHKNAAACALKDHPSIVFGR